MHTTHASDGQAIRCDHQGFDLERNQVTVLYEICSKTNLFDACCAQKILEQTNVQWVQPGAWLPLTLQGAVELGLPFLKQLFGCLQLNTKASSCIPIDRLRTSGLKSSESSFCEGAWTAQPNPGASSRSGLPNLSA